MTLKKVLIKTAKVFSIPLGLSLGTFVFYLVKGVGFDMAFTKALAELAIFSVLVLGYAIVTGR